MPGINPPRRRPISNTSPLIFDPSTFHCCEECPMTLRSRFALRLVAAFALCVPLAACDNKKTVGPAKRAAGTGARGADAPANFNLQPPNGAPEAPNTENHPHFIENDYVSAEREPRSTFSASVDTA